jgi:hypothetical protein
MARRGIRGHGLDHHPIIAAHRAERTHAAYRTARMTAFAHRAAAESAVLRKKLKECDEYVPDPVLYSDVPAMMRLGVSSLQGIRT